MLLHRLEYAVFCVARFIIVHLPISVTAAASAHLWRVIAPRLKRHRRAAKNLRIAMPEISDTKLERILANMWDNLGRTSVEAFHLHKIADAENSLELNLTTGAQQILESDKPAIFISLHSGNWEVTAIAAERFRKPLIGIYKRIENPFVDREVRCLRSRFYTGGLYSRAPETVSLIINGIKSGYSVAIMADLRDSHGAIVPFFGVASKSTSFPALLSRRYNLPIVAIRAVRTSNLKFRIDAVELSLNTSKDRKDDIEKNTAIIQSHLEEWIRESPELWMWGHRRW